MNLINLQHATALAALVTVAAVEGCQHPSSIEISSVDSGLPYPNLTVCHEYINKHSRFYEHGKYVASIDSLTREASQDRVCRSYPEYRNAVRNSFLRSHASVEGLSNDPDAKLEAIKDALEIPSLCTDAYSHWNQYVDWHLIVKSNIINSDAFLAAINSVQALTAKGLRIAHDAMTSTDKQLDRGMPYDQIVNSLGMYCHALGIYRFAADIDLIDVTVPPYDVEFKRALNHCLEHMPLLQTWKDQIQDPHVPTSLTQRLIEIEGFQSEFAKKVKEVHRRCRSTHKPSECDIKD